jgi:ribonuclease P protein component
MAAQSHRLARADFDTYRRAPAKNTTHFRIQYAHHTLPYGKYAVIVPKKAVSGAVKRHFIKRRVREALRLWLQNPMVLIITARQGAERLSYTEIEGELSEALRDILPTRP